jgi:ZIP family zinc transporter
MWIALLWGLVGASSLVLGAWLGLARQWRESLVGSVLGFGAGALIASVSFELTEEGFRVGGPIPLAAGLTCGAVAFYAGDRVVEGRGGRAGGGGAGMALALGALLDGIPEQAVLGIGLAQGEGVSVALLLAVFVSNLPEAIGSATDMRAAGKAPRQVLLGWAAVAAVCAVSTVGGHLASQVTAAPFEGAVDGFAAGALLVMLVGSMIPEAREKAGEKAGLFAVLGFAVAAGISVTS